MCRSQVKVSGFSLGLCSWTSSLFDFLYLPIIPVWGASVYLWHQFSDGYKMSCWFSVCSALLFFIIIIFSFIFISWRLITLQYCSGFCHTLTWISHGFTCVPYPDPPSRSPLPPPSPSHPSMSSQFCGEFGSDVFQASSMSACNPEFLYFQSIPRAIPHNTWAYFGKLAFLIVFSRNQLYSEGRALHHPQNQLFVFYSHTNSGENIALNLRNWPLFWDMPVE